MSLESIVHVWIQFVSVILTFVTLISFILDVLKRVTVLYVADTVWLFKRVNNHVME